MIKKQKDDKLLLKGINNFIAGTDSIIKTKFKLKSSQEDSRNLLKKSCDGFLSTAKRARAKYPYLLKILIKIVKMISDNLKQNECEVEDNFLMNKELDKEYQVFKFGKNISI